MTRAWTPWRLLAVLLLLAACNDPPDAPVPPTLVVVQAPSPVGAPGWALIDTLKVRVQDEDGTPRPGIPLTWTVREGGGSIAPIADTTDAEGLAAAVWTLGDQAGPNAVRVSTFQGAFVDFQSTGEAFRVDRLASSGELGCGIVDGAIWCWGAFWANTAPVSYNDDFGWSNSSPGLLDDSRTYVELAVAWDTACGVDEARAVWCMNYGFPEGVRVDGLPPVHGIVSTTFRTGFCAIAVSDSTAWCWQMGGAPAQVPGSTAFTSLSLDYAGSYALGCGLKTDSTAACWGPAPLGDGTMNSSETPVPVAGDHRFAELAAGQGFACGRAGDGSVWCWGRDPYGESPLRLSPELVATGAYRIVGGWQDAQLLRRGPAVLRWRGASFDYPRTLSGLDGRPVDRFANDEVSCLQLADEQVYCHDEMFNSSTGIYYDNFSPIQPVRPAPAASPNP